MQITVMSPVLLANGPHHFPSELLTNDLSHPGSPVIGKQIVWRATVDHGAGAEIEEIEIVRVTHLEHNDPTEDDVQILNPNGYLVMNTPQQIVAGIIAEIDNHHN